MILRLLFFIITMTAFSPDLIAGSSSPEAVKGIMDLRGISNPEHFIVNLNGQWEFFWGRMLRPYDFEAKDLKPDYYGKVPSYWTDYPKDSVSTKKFGYATYRLTILLPEGYNYPLGIDLPVFDSSYDFFIYFKYTGGIGIPGRTSEETEPGYGRNFYRIVPADTMILIINVSNFDHRRGGFWLPVKFGTFSDTQKQLANSWAGEWAVISILAGFSVFFLFFFFISSIERSIGFFSLATIGLASRPFFTSHFLIYSLVDISWDWTIRFEYTGLFMILIGTGWFILYLYPSELYRKINWIFTIIFSIAFLATLILPVKIFSYSILLFYPSILFLLGYILFRSLAGALKKKTIEIVYFFTFCLLLFGGVHDIMVSLGKAESSVGYILSYIIVVFVFAQTILMLYKWVKAYHEKEKLKNELEFMNRNLEVLVRDRTSELQARNEEIQMQNSRIAMQNKQLSDTIQLKNRIFSVIAHDLRSPVVNILYMLNLLKEEEFKEKYDTFANSSIKYAQSVISLLENMLVWGRGQEDKINFAPEKRDLADIILTNLSIFKETADKKEISVNFTQVGNSEAFIDKDLLDIIIRNLLSNAVKYAPRGGRISILLKDKKINGEGIMLKICDNGTGIPEKKQKQIFTAAEVKSTPGTEDEKGTGLGLKLCYELVKIHKGSIEIESKVNEGTCVIIKLPADQEM